MLTVQDAFDEIDHVLNASGSPDIDRLLLLNRAGQLFFSLPWRWLENRVWTVRLNAGVTRLRAPRDAAQVLAIAPKDYNTSWVYRFEDDYERLLEVRRLNLDVVGTLLAGVWVENDEGVRELWIEAYPGPPGAVDLEVRGRVGWARVGEGEPYDRTVIPLPESMAVFEPAFLEVVKAYARGREDDAKTDMESEMARALNSPLMMAAKDADRRALGATTGSIRMTAMQMAARSRRMSLGNDYPYDYGVTFQ
jgi:hypothetical protein